LVDTILTIAMGISLTSLALVMIRFLHGPAVLDRVVAFDTASIITISIIILIAHLVQRFIYVDIALVYGLLGFLGVLVVARYYERGL